MDEKKTMQHAQGILDWAISNLNLSIKCMVINYVKEKYKVQFFTRDNKLIRAVGFDIPEEWIKDTNPGENYIRDELKSLLRSLEQEAKSKRR